MIIGFDASRAFLQNRTGTENYSYQLLTHLARLDTENTYLVYVRPNFSMYTSEVYTSIWPENFQFITLNFPRFWTQAGLALQTFKDKLDLLFVPAHTLPLMGKPGLKTVVTVHDLGAEYLPVMHQLKQLIYLKLMTHLQIKSASKIIAVSKATKQDLIKKVGIDPDKVEVVYEGVDRRVFKPVKGDTLINTLNKFELEKGKYFLFVGTIQPRKNLDRLIKAFSLFVSRGPSSLSPLETKLILVGGEGWLADEIYKLPKKLGIEDRVKFLGRVEGKDLPALYSGTIGLTMPSLFEGFGLPILEAMSCGCPVLTSNISSMPEVAGKAAILVNPDSVSEIVDGMRKLLDDRVRDKLIDNGFKQVEKFSWEKCARETLGVFEKVVRQPADNL